MPRIDIIFKCIFLKNDEFRRDEFFIFFSMHLIKQCLYSESCCFFLQIFVFNDIFNVRKFSIFLGEKNRYFSSEYILRLNSTLSSLIYVK